MDDKKLIESINHCKEVIDSLMCGKRKEEHKFLLECLTDYKRLKDLEADGRLIVLPCKVGDTVYIKNKPMVISFSHIENEIYHVVLFDCDDCGDCPFYEDDVSYEGEHDCRTRGYLEFTEKDIGKTVFLTRKEAEKALAERSDDNV